MVNIAKMAKFDEKMRFLVGETAKKLQKCVRGWPKNMIGMSCARRVFQKVTVGVSLVKQPVRQNEMGVIWARFANSFPLMFSRRSLSSVCVMRKRFAASSVAPMWSSICSFFLRPLRL